MRQQPSKNPRHTLFSLGDKKEKCQATFGHAINSEYYNRCFARKLERFFPLGVGLQPLPSICRQTTRHTNIHNIFGVVIWMVDVQVTKSMLY